MRQLALLSVFACALAAIACGSTNPDMREPDWEETFDRVNKATAAGEHQQAVSLSQAFLKKHPDNADGLLMVAGALTEAASAASDQQRPAQFTEAAAQYQRVLAVSKNPTWRLLASSGLVDIYRNGLNDLDGAARYARVSVDERPQDLSAYGALVDVLVKAGRIDDALSVLAEAKAKVEFDATTRARFAGIVHDLVVLNTGVPRDKGAALLDDTLLLIDQGIARDGRTADLLQARGMLLRAQSETATDPARQSALAEQSRKTFEELDQLKK